MSLKFKKIAIANRGEVAARIIRACQELGLTSVLLHSDADINSVAYRLADERVCIGPAALNESYLNIDNNINAALSAGVDAIHPGFGFLSENADFAAACEKNRIKFIGPSSENIHLFGDKISAKHLVEKAGGPTIPGYASEDQSMPTLLKECEKIGYPVMVKVAGGGGGRGLKLIKEASEAQAQIESAKREGASSFGSDRVFLEKYLGQAKHIEVQIFGDAAGNIFHLYDRECTIQRRHQKVIEEAPFTDIDFELRQSMLDAAVRIAKEAKYEGAGTVEFLLQDGEFFFLEMNTRLQVEHPVTEMVMGVDLVKAQILTAAGQSTLWFQEELRPRGHSIECRIYAEDSYQGGMPSTGEVLGVHFPYGPGRRFDYAFDPGDTVTPFYDSMIAKIIVWDESRPRAIQKTIETLSETVIFGVKTNIPYLKTILNHPEFCSGEMTTQFIDKYLPNGLEQKELSLRHQEILKEVSEQMSVSKNTNTGNASHKSPWSEEF